MCEARPGHDLSDGDIIKAVAIEEPARALNDFRFYLGTVACSVGHKSSGFRRSIARRAFYFPLKYDLEHILGSCCYARRGE